MTHDPSIHSNPYTLVDPDNEVMANIRAEYGSNPFGPSAPQSAPSNGGGSRSWLTLKRVLIGLGILLFAGFPGIIASIIAIVSALF